MLSFELDCVIPMDILGVVEETTCDGRIIIRCDALPDIGDSVFAKGGRLGTVGRVFGPVDSPYASVNPVGGAKVKSGRIVYLTVNSESTPTLTLPDIADNSSVREAEARLKAMGFRLLPPEEITGEKDWVYAVKARGRRLSVGDRVPIDVPLTLVVGSGTYDDSLMEIDYVSPSEITVTYGGEDDFEAVDAPPADAGAADAQGAMEATE